MPKLKPPIGWFGGKQQLFGKLLPLLPDHQTYVEGFGGAGALLFAKAPSPVEVYNDIYSDLVNFMRVLRDRGGMFPDFYNRACLSPYSRDECLFCRDHLNDDPDPVERARRFFTGEVLFWRTCRQVVRNQYHFIQWRNGTDGLFIQRGDWCFAQAKRSSDFRSHREQGFSRYYSCLRYRGQFFYLYPLTCRKLEEAVITSTR